METDRNQIPAGADALALPGCAHRLRCVFQYAQLVPARDRIQAAAIDRQAGQIHRQQGAGQRCDGRLDAGQIDIAGARVDVDEYRPRAGAHDDVRRGDPGQRCGDDLIAGADAGERQADLESSGAGTQRTNRPTAKIIRQPRLELAHLRATGDPARAQHFGDSGDGVLIDRRSRKRQEFLAHDSTVSAPQLQLRATNQTPRMMTPMPVTRAALSCSENSSQAASAFTT